jgi:light-regulated signal transduction histidine kinase (bacteriophytochrome)
MDVKKDISSILISEHGIRQILPSILVDAIVLDEDFKIIAASQNVLDYIGFTNEELKLQPINFLAGGKNLKDVLKTSLLPGYFFEKRTQLLSKNKKWIAVEITGFYLGLISDLNGSIILKVKNLEEINRINEQLLLKKVELDDFIYRTSHDLRGPLATIRGLANLIRVRESDEELDALIAMMVERTDKLDERLSQLLYLTQAEREVIEPKSLVNFKTIEKAVRNIANQNRIPAFIKLLYKSPEDELTGINEILLQALVVNLLQHLLSLPMSRLDSLISIDFNLEGKFLQGTISAEGFVISEELKAALSRSEFIYSDVLNYPRLVNFFTARKIALGLQCEIKLKIIAEDFQELTFRVPFETDAELSSIITEPKLEMCG